MLSSNVTANQLAAQASLMKKGYQSIRTGYNSDCIAQFLENEDRYAACWVSTSIILGHVCFARYFCFAFDIFYWIFEISQPLSLAAINMSWLFPPFTLSESFNYSALENGSFFFSTLVRFFSICVERLVDSSCFLRVQKAVVERN